MIRTNIVLIVATKHHDISRVDLHTRRRTEMLYRQHDVRLDDPPRIRVGIITLNRVGNELTIKFHRDTTKLIQIVSIVVSSYDILSERTYAHRCTHLVQ